MAIQQNQGLKEKQMIWLLKKSIYRMISVAGPSYQNERGFAGRCEKGFAKISPSEIGRTNRPGAEDEHVHQKNEDIRKELPIIIQIRLFRQEAFDCKADVEKPGQPD